MKNTTLATPADATNIQQLVESISPQNDFKYKLVRTRDGLTKQSQDIIWIEFDESGRLKSKHKEVALGRSLLMSPFSAFFTWQCTETTEILEQREGYLKFNTRNSCYELFVL